MKQKGITTITDYIDKNNDVKLKFYLTENPSSIKLTITGFIGKLFIEELDYLVNISNDSSLTIDELETKFKKGWHTLTFKSKEDDVQRILIDLITDIDNQTFKEQTIEELKQELEILKDKKQKALENNNNSDYKLLINNFKQVLELILELEKPQITTTTWSVDTVANNKVDQFLNNGLYNISSKSQNDIYNHLHTKDSIDDIINKFMVRFNEEFNKAGLRY